MVRLMLRAANPIVGALAFVFVAAASLALPWLSIGSAAGRSSIDLIGSLNALDVLGGPALAIVLGSWLAVPVAAAGALLLGAWGRSTGAAVLVLAISMLIGLAAATVAVVDEVALAWGGVVGGVAAVVAGACAAAALVAGR